MESRTRPAHSWVALIGLALALLLGAFVRLIPSVTQPWAPNDGGLFLAMVKAIDANHLMLPARVYYPIAGQDYVPFCYPPLGFYLAVLAGKLGIPAETYIRFGPALWGVVAIWAFWRMARAIFSDERHVAGATVAYALLPQSMIWNVMGGGVTRGAVFVFVFLTLECAARLWRQRENAPPRLLLYGTLCLTAVLAYHLERFHFTVLSLLLLWAFWGRDRKSFGQFLMLLAGAAVLTAPWWGLCLSRFGIGPFIAALGSGGSFLSRTWHPPLWYFDEPFLPVLTAFGITGLVLLMRRREWLIPLWLLLVLLFEMRSTRIFWVIPLALAMGETAAVLWPGPGRRFAPLRVSVLGFGLLWGLMISSMTATRIFSLTVDELKAMEWARRNTPPQAEFLLLPVGQWAQDRPAEWFPALAGRRSLSTVQGSEWLRGEFQPRVDRQDALWKAKHWTEVTAWLSAKHMTPDYVWVPRHGGQGYSHKELEVELEKLPEAKLVLRNGSASIFKLSY